jgi:hypothetical protein
MNYFVEFEFEGLYPYLYWFPVCIAAENPTEAEDHATRIQTAIEQNYALKHRSRAIPVIAGINSERIEEYRRRRAVGTPMVLNIREWEMRSVKGAPEIPFEKQTSNEICALPARFPANADGSMTLATAVQRRFPVHIAYAEKDLGREFLLINVVLPKKEEELGADNDPQS